jgi:hypothetical protein
MPLEKDMYLKTVRQFMDIEESTALPVSSAFIVIVGENLLEKNL